MQRYYKVQCPVHQILAFTVEAESAEQAAQLVRDNPMQFQWSHTHDWRDDSHNVFEPIEVNRFPHDADPNDEEHLEFDTGYLRFLNAGGK